MAGKRNILNLIGPTVPFHMPNITGKFYRPGRQPNNPGESQIDNIDNGAGRMTPWPNAVPVINALANNPGIPRDRALGISNNSDAPLLANYLFLAGVAQKSKG